MVETIHTNGKHPLNCVVIKRIQIYEFTLY